MSTARARLASGRSSLREGLGALRYVPALFRQVWRTSRVLTVATVLVRAVRAILPVLILFVAKLIIDEIVAQMSVPRVDAEFSDWLASGRLARLVMLFAVELALAVTLDLLGRVGVLVDTLLAELYVNEISVELMRHASSLDLEQFESSEHQDRIERARRQASGRSSLLAQILTQAQDLLTVIGFSIGLAAYAPWLILLLLFALLPACLGEAYFNARAYSLNFAKTPERRELDYLRYIGASVETARENRIFGLSRFLIDRFRRLAREIYVANRTLAIQRASWGGLFAAIALAAYYGAYAVIAWRTLTGALTIGDLTFLAGSLLRLRSLLEGLLLGFSQLAGQALYLGDLFSFFTIHPQVVSPERPRPFPSPLREGFRFEDVSFRYTQGEETWTLEDVTLRVAPGEVVALVGPSGGGKTTLVSLLSRFWDVDRGHVRLDGHDVRAIRLADLRGSIGIVPQEPALFSGSVRENIAYARPGASAAEVEAAARAAHAHEFIERLPHGYDTPVGERGVKLSGGQRQRVAIARAILKDPAVLVLDEATSNLDTESERLIEDALEKLLVGRTTLIIAHRLSTVRRADRLVVVDRGRIVEEGTHAALLARGGLYARLYQRQFREDEFLLEPASGSGDTI